MTNPARWRDLSDRELEALYLTVCAENFQWRADHCALDGGRLSMNGWALTLSGAPGDARFLLNGTPFEKIDFPLPSPDLAQIFWNIPTAPFARFACRTRADFQDGYARLEFRDGRGPVHSLRRAWYLPNPKDDLPVPEASRIRRVIGVPDSFNFLIGGASIYKRVDLYLKERLGKGFDEFRRVLDFGCGCGRVARNFRWSKDTRLAGVDIDGDNIQWCRDHLPHGDFAQIAALPPLPFPDESFDLIVSVSVMCQMTEDYQFAWLHELHRVAQRGALVLVAVPGLTQIGLARPHPQFMRDIEEKGFLVSGRNPDLDDVMPEQTHYVSGIHSREYLHANYSRYFRIIEIVDAIAANDDLVVLEKSRSDLA